MVQKAAHGRLKKAASKRARVYSLGSGGASRQEPIDTTTKITAAQHDPIQALPAA